MSKIVQFIKSQWVPFKNFGKVIEHNTAEGGYFKRVSGLVMTQIRMKDIKQGRLVGTDKYGNKYYENDEYHYTRNRWVDYAKRSWTEKWDYDASQVPGEWHRWLHYMTDDPPTEVPPIPRKFELDHAKNQTGKNSCYVPYSTTRPKIESWKPQ